MGRARWPQVGLTARVRIATLLVAVALGVVFAVLLHTVDDLDKRDDQARHSADVLESAAQIEGSVIDLETGLRGYIITADTRYLQPYQAARSTQPRRLAALQRLVAEDHSQTLLARDLAGELNSYVHDYAVPVIAAVRAGRRIGPQRLSEGKVRVDQIRATLARFTAVEDRLQVSRRAAAKSARHRARLLTILGLALLVIVVIGSGAYASRHVATPLRRLARSARGLASGRFDERVEPGGVAELSDLGAAFNQMAASLEDRTRELELLSESSTAQFSAIFEQTPIGLTLFDRDLRCIRCNPALGELAGVDAAEQAGRAVSEVFGEFEPDLSPEFGRVLEVGSPLSARRIFAEGRTCTVNLFPVRRADGELIGVAAVVVDVTEREQRLQRERVAARRAQRLEGLTASISEALTPADISRAVVAEAVAALEGDGGAVLLLDEERDTLSMVAGVGWAESGTERFDRLPLSLESPITEAVRTRRVVHTGGPDEPGDAATSLALPLLSGPRRVGGLLITFSNPRRFDEDELQFAQDVAERCANGIGRALLYEREHATAAALQRSLMPPALPMFDAVTFGARFRPAGSGVVVGGDFYDVLRLSGNRFVAWVGDVQGKGPTAAAMAALARYTLRAETRHESHPARLLEALNEAVLGESAIGDRLLTAACIAGKLRGDLLELEMASAGHPPPLLSRRGQRTTEWGSSGRLIGFEDTSFASDRLTLEPGDVLVLYTDGLTDAHAPQVVLKPEDLCRVVDETERASIGHVLDALLARASSGEDDQPRDDIALLGLEVASSARGRGV